MAKKAKLTAAQKRIKIIGELKKFKSIFASISFKPFGIDQSLSRTGVSNIVKDKLKLRAVETKIKGSNKYISIARKINSILKKDEPNLVAIEGYAFGTKWGREQMGELAGLIKYFLFKRKIPFFIIAPPTVKKWIGVKEKENIIKEVYKQYKIDAKNNDEADAFILMMILQGIYELTKYKGIDAIDHKQVKKFNKRKHQVLMTVLLGGIHYPEVNYGETGETQEDIYGRRIKTKKIKLKN